MDLASPGGSGTVTGKWEKRGHSKFREKIALGPLRLRRRHAPRVKALESTSNSVKKQNVPPFTFPESYPGPDAACIRGL